MKRTTFALSLLVLAFMSGCASKEQEFNKPALYWYEKMVHAASVGNLENADSYYSSLQSEHVGSPLLSEATLMLALAHMEHDEFLLSEHFLNEYIKRFASQRQREYAEFLKVKAKYLALPNAKRDEGLIKDAITTALAFKSSYAESAYMPSVDTILTRLYVAQASLNEAIAKLYDRLDKPKAAAYYRSIKPEPWIEWEGVEEADVPFYRAMFEGSDGESWYAFLIPDTQSVVSKKDR